MPVITLNSHSKTTDPTTF